MPSVGWHGQAGTDGAPSADNVTNQDPIHQRAANGIFMDSLGDGDAVGMTR